MAVVLATVDGVDVVVVVIFGDFVVLKRGGNMEIVKLGFIVVVVVITAVVVVGLVNSVSISVKSDVAVLSNKSTTVVGSVELGGICAVVVVVVVVLVISKFILEIPIFTAHTICSNSKSCAVVSIFFIFYLFLNNYFHLNSTPNLAKLRKIKLRSMIIFPDERVCSLYL